ncbi:hypothetical protein [Bradyrhizobium erythrophlei]|uniref:hypothetical protein n=1 Tax=Bradyrhizobium erythrophlei TaxID=1437360 RepID=UPI00155F8F66|nr:hypothetical protein [Bradyrhizobium erythrophlei]
MADAAKEVAPYALDPLMWFGVLAVFAKSWKGGLIVLALVLGAVAFATSTLWQRNRNVQVPDD